MRKPKLFWISAAAPLTSVILSTLIVYLLRSTANGIPTVRIQISILFFLAGKENFSVIELKWSCYNRKNNALREHSESMKLSFGTAIRKSSTCSSISSFIRKNDATKEQKSEAGKITNSQKYTFSRYNVVAIHWNGIAAVFSNCNSLWQIGHLPKGLNPPSSNMLYFQGAYLGVALKTGIVTGILALTVSFSRNYHYLKLCDQMKQNSCKKAKKANIINTIFLVLKGRNCCWKDICCFEKLPSWW